MAKIRTEKQKKLVLLISENLGLAKPKTMMQMMLEAGYEESVARQQSSILVGIREDLDPIVQRLIEHRERVMDQLTKKLSQAKYHNLVDAMDKLTKAIQLLSGKATEHTAIVVNIAASIASKHAIDPSSRGGSERPA